ncbi:RNA polymerase sigma factor [Stigmatella aurantiaca]|uniref:RNA polymerase sigma-70 factor n=1 Tax=Stigmatella aurantiaca (strain DW4/3-1) TaxID=378806 RepID=Q098V1_STIAD|nr:RNA polymerase sigma factor [Stigmatella aurantiaca]ADO75503.1 RNA polymerase sigma-70 factor [Stigmatella aurantiaca DW4/3-1]EAU68317.1 RNA polymerase sigma-70 factor, ECF subfamily [Stigmatella aurantiaca DW4/3-1]
MHLEMRHGHSAGASPDAGLETLRRDLDKALASVCPPSLADRRDDLLQVAMMRVVELRKRDPGHAALSSAYLYRVAYTALIDELRRVNARKEVALEEGEQAPVQPVAPGDPERSAGAAQIARAVRDCLQGLMQDRRLAVTLHLQGHTLHEAAELLGWESKRTENLIYRGLSALRACLSTKGVTP